MTFEPSYENWLQRQLEGCKKGRRKRVLALHKGREPLFLREVWFPVMGSLDGLVPEYELISREGQAYHLQYAFLRGGVQVNIEIDDWLSGEAGFTRHAYLEQRRRDIRLEASGWRVLRMGLEDVISRPLICRELLEQWMTLWGGCTRSMTEMQWRQEQVMRLARNEARAVSILEVSEHLAVSDKTARRLMREWMKQGTFTAASSGKQRIHRYKLVAGSTISPHRL